MFQPDSSSIVNVVSSVKIDRSYNRNTETQGRFNATLLILNKYVKDKFIAR